MLNFFLLKIAFEALNFTLKQTSLLQQKPRPPLFHQRIAQHLCICDVTAIRQCLQHIQLYNKTLTMIKQTYYAQTLFINMTIEAKANKKCASGPFINLVSFSFCVFYKEFPIKHYILELCKSYIYINYCTIMFLKLVS